MFFYLRTNDEAPCHSEREIYEKASVFQFVSSTFITYKKALSPQG
ncbi:hypothetical protein GCM10011384_35530 [Psychrobacillus lasiicapitis]|nr:hypothetical protein GCM10011384_35530 [Psychrobacillus lasiicapitis]